MFFKSLANKWVLITTGIGVVFAILLPFIFVISLAKQQLHPKIESNVAKIINHLVFISHSPNYLPAFYHKRLPLKRYSDYTPV